MNIFEFAMQMELDGKRFYLDLSEKTNDPGLRQILTLMAEDEVKHYFLLDNIYELLLRPEIWLENAEFNHLEGVLKNRSVDKATERFF